MVGLFLVLVFLRVPIVYAIGIASLADFFYLHIQFWVEPFCSGSSIT